MLIPEPIDQRDGVTILNNVINPDLGETVTLTYTLRSPGITSVYVTDLEGTVVEFLKRGPESAGDYRVYWDGRNRGGRPIARGLYFVHIIGPRLSAIRKVLVVR